MMNLTQTGMPEYFQITAEDFSFKVKGTHIHQTESDQIEEMISNLADMLESAIVFAKDGDMVDRVLDAHGLIRDKE